MPTKYIEALRFVQPDGPYFLGGASFGGAVAFEMAQLLNYATPKIQNAITTLLRKFSHDRRYLGERILHWGFNYDVYHF